MLITEKHKDIRATVMHRISGDVTIEDAERGVKEAVEIIETDIQQDGRINVIINMQGANFTSLMAHKTWRQGIGTASAIRQKIDYVIMIIGDSPQGRAEKEFMQTETLKFFFDLDEATKWLRDRKN